MPAPTRRLTASVTAALALFFGATAFAASSQAAPYTHAPALSVSNTCPSVGAAITVVGTDFVPGSNVTLTLRTQTFPLGSVTADASGGFTASVTLPSEVTGSHTIVAAGAATTTNSNTATAGITIACSGVGGTGGGGGGGGGGLATTGIAVIGIGSLGLVLLLGGGLMLLAGKRRRVSA